MSIFLVNPFLLTPISFARTYFSSGYNNARTTTTSTTFQTRTTLNTTETAGDYAAFWMGTVDHASTTADGRAQLVETSVRQLSNIEPQDATDIMGMGGMYTYTGGTNKTFTIQYSGESTSTTGIAGTELNVLKLHPSDKWAHNSGTTAATANAVSVTITEPGDYIVIGSGMLSGGGNAGLFDGTTTYGAVGVAMNQDATSWSPFWHIERLNGLTNQTLSVRVTTGSIRTSSILALRVDKFANVYYAEQPTQQSSTATAVTDAFTQTFTIANPSNRHLILACAQLNPSSTTISGGCYFRNTTTATIYNGTHNRESNAATEYYPTVVERVVTFTGASNTFAWSYFSETAGTAIRIRNMAMVILDLGVT